MGGVGPAFAPRAAVPRGYGSPGTLYVYALRVGKLSPTANFPPVKVTLYVPDALGARAKAAGLNFSGLLRAALEDALSGGEVGETIPVSAERLGDEIVIRLRAE